MQHNVTRQLNTDRTPAPDDLPSPSGAVACPWVANS